MRGLLYRSFGRTGPKSHHDRKLVNKSDIWLVGGVVFAALLLAVFFALFFGNRTENDMVHIAKNGQVVLAMDLSVDGYFVLESLPAVRFEVRDGHAAFAESDCPDQICVRTGFLNRPGQMAVCLPNRVSLTVAGDGDGPDVFVPGG